MAEAVLGECARYCDLRLGKERRRCAETGDPLGSPARSVVRKRGYAVRGRDGRALDDAETGGVAVGGTPSVAAVIRPIRSLNDIPACSAVAAIPMPGVRQGLAFTSGTQGSPDRSTRRSTPA